MILDPSHPIITVGSKGHEQVELILPLLGKIFHRYEYSKSEQSPHLCPARSPAQRVKRKRRELIQGLAYRTVH
eukprot:228709-Hanusia_phi.AAC.1